MSGSGLGRVKTLTGDVGEKPRPVRSQATIAAISGLAPTMFMNRVIWRSADHFRSSPSNGHGQADPALPKSANGGHAGANLEQAINELTATEPMNALPMLA
jgi:hypothetical protein